jgi:membrane protein required for colicin V production
MSGVDWLMMAVVVLSTATAASQGFFYEAFSLAGVVLGYLFAAWGYRQVAPWFAPYVNSPWVANMVAFLVVFVAVVMLAGAAGRMTRWAMKEVGLRWFDRMVGAVFGFVRGVLVLMVFALAVASFAPGSKLLAGSSMAPYLLAVARGAVWLAPSQVRQQFWEGMGTLQQMRQEQKPSAQRPG